MFLFILFAIFARSIASASDIYCCSKEQGLLLHDENFCFNEATNTTTPMKLTCHQTIYLSSFDYNFTVSHTGALILHLEGLNDQEGDPGTFCIANETSNLTERMVVLCDEEPPAIEEDILGICMFVSVGFLALIVLVYALLPDIRDLQGKSIINFCGSLMFAMGFLGYLKILTTVTEQQVCSVLAFLSYFFLLATFFWMNAISIQIFINLRRPTTADYGWRQFFWYALYAFGAPALLTVAMATVNYLPGTHTKPGIGLNSCWFTNTKQQWYYMYSVMSVLLAANICIFIYMSVLLWRTKYAFSHTKALRYKLLMTVRLLILMGLPWMFEMISSFSPPHIIWAITDIINILQGPLMFLVLVVFRRRVIKALFHRGYLDCMSGVVERHLAVGDDEEDVVEHTTADGLEFDTK